MPTGAPVIDAAWYAKIRAAVADGGFADEIKWAANIAPPASADHFAEELIYVICNSGMKQQIARAIFDRIMVALRAGQSATTAFGHAGKAESIDRLWTQRARLFANYQHTGNKLKWLADVPWIGAITKYHAAKNFGLDVIKPDRHLRRLADAAGTTPHLLCRRLADASGDRLAVVDTVLWRAANLGIIDTARLAGSRGAA